MKKIKYYIIFVLIIGIFMFYRGQSYEYYKDNLEMLETKKVDSELVPETTVGNIIQGTKVNQVINIISIDKMHLESIGILLATNGRENYSAVNIELKDANTLEVLQIITIEAEKLLDNNFYEILIDKEKVDNLDKIQLEITSNADENNAITIWKNISNSEFDGKLFINQEKQEGNLCYYLSYKDDGKSYMQFLPIYIILSIIVSIILTFLIKILFCYLPYIKNAKSYINVLLHYRYLLKELVSRDIKVKYKRSILGLLWSVLSPLMMMIIMNFVFSTIFKSNIENFPVYLLCGQIIFNYYSEATNGSMTSIVSNMGLLTKVYIPKYIFPLSKVLTALVNLGFQLIALIIVMIFTNTLPHITILLFPVAIFYVSLFALGIGLILSSMTVFFRDIIHIYGIILLAWTYLTPIFYPLDIMPVNVKLFIQFNPLYNYIEFFRQVVLYGELPSLRTNLMCSIFSFAALMIGVKLFKKNQDRFILYV